VLTLDEREQVAVRRMFRLIDHPVLQDVTIDWGDLDVEQVYPSVLPDVLASRPLVVHGQYIKGGSGTVTVRGKTLDGTPVAFKAQVDLPHKSTHGAAISSLWARARVEELSRALWSGHDQTAVDAITQTGIEHRLVTAYTSFVAVDRSRTVQGEAVQIDQPVERADKVDISKAVGIHKALGSGTLNQGALNNLFSGDVGGATGFGGLGLRGRGTGGGGGIGVGKFGAGGGRGYGRGAARLGERKSNAPRLLMGKPMITGSLDKNIIRRVIRRRQRGLRYCYEKGLTRNPNLGGKLEVTWTIDSKGRVTAVELGESMLKDAKVEGCIVRQIKRWRFPAPKGGGAVKVRYPFIFKKD
jgi:Ca-activated chloride channel family protein